MFSVLVGHSFSSVSCFGTSFGSRKSPESAPGSLGRDHDLCTGAGPGGGGGGVGGALGRARSLVSRTERRDTGVS